MSLLYEQTKGLTLEEIGGKFNDVVEISFDDAIAYDAGAGGKTGGVEENNKSASA